METPLILILKEGSKERKEILGSYPVLLGTEESPSGSGSLIVLERKYLTCEICNSSKRGLEFSQ